MGKKSGLKPCKHLCCPDVTIREYARLQGVPDDYVFPDKISSYKIIGNGVPVPMARWIGQQLMNYFN